ncbi:silent information regulator protein Sir2 [Bacteroides sp. 51]|uniref:rhamnogalacturonan lyase family protein n=1 Tax=Bacteroides sp. 51 TaxID=2302938 RepID=UPI0013D00D3A|nr:silent information regulator protein Sir2 [Bacteroides sp. 51]NDV82164.1 silent information regulator protein Sir2 [Bacteroides sp. 51]
MKHSFLQKLALGILAAIPCLTFAQDLRERTYYYEILEPRHEPKSQITGFAHERVKEKLDRGLAASLAQDGKSVYLSWRLLEDDPESVSFNVYRSVNGKTKRLNSRPVKQTCDFVDASPNSEAMYWVSAIANNKEQPASSRIEVKLSDLSAPNYTSIKLNQADIRAGKIALADLNGDGAYDYIIRTPASNVDPGNPGDLNGKTYQIEAYLNDGTYLWTKDLGQGIEPGIWYSPFIAYDFNGDGKAEIALKTAPDHVKRNEQGRVDGGEEHLSILDGMTGKEIARVDWPGRNDRYGNLNRQNRNQIGMAFLDGKTPFILAARGTYKLMVVDAWMLKGDKLERVWRWDGDEENPVVRSMGSHSMICADIDDDGRDEIILGSCALDDNGTLLWSTGLGHPDKIYLTDIDPARPGMELFLCLEPWHDNGRGVCVVDPKDGKSVWNIGHKTFHVGDGMVTDFDPTHPGLECSATEDKKGGSTDKYLLTSDGKKIGSGNDVPPCRNWAWWDADLLRETFKGDDNRWGAGSSSGGRKQSIVKWKAETLTEGIEGDILMIADVVGDWREEIITALPGELRIYRTNIPAKDRRVTLMQDALYRNYIAHRSMGYPQAPVPSYYLGE